MLTRLAKILIAIILLTALLAALAWWWFDRASQSTSGPDATVGAGGIFPGGALKSLFNDLTGNDDANPVEGGEGAVAIGTGNQVAPRFQRVAVGPVADLARVGPPADGAAATLVYLERDTGHLYRLGASGESERLSNTTIPQTFQLIAATPAPTPVAKTKTATTTVTLIIRHFKDGRLQNFLTSIKFVATAAGLSAEAGAAAGDFFVSTNPLATPAGEAGDSASLSPLSGQFIPADITNLAVSPDQKNFAFLAVRDGEGQIGTVDLAFKKAATVFSSPLREWRIYWPTLTSLVLATRPSGLVPGYAYRLDLSSKQLTRLVDRVNGLEILPSPNGRRWLYSGTDERGGSPFLALYDLSTQQLTRVPTGGLADKCVWTGDSTRLFCAAPSSFPSTSVGAGSAAVYPDDWLAGDITLNDKIWQIEAASGQSQLVFDPALASPAVNLDVWKLALNPAEDGLYLINKNDLSLWSLRLGSEF